LSPAFGRPQFFAQSFESSSGHINPADMPKDTVFPNHHLAKGPVNINANHASHARLPVVAHEGSGGRHDTYGSALTAQPGESQRRPATNASSQLMQCVGLPAPSCSRRLCPGWSHIRRNQSDRSRDKRRRHPHTGYQHHRECHEHGEARMPEREAMALGLDGDALDRGRHAGSGQRLPTTDIPVGRRKWTYYNGVARLAILCRRGRRWLGCAFRRLK
jgi:hypothetical protein